MKRGAVQFNARPAAVAVLFVDTRPMDAIVFHNGLLGADDPKSFFGVP